MYILILSLNLVSTAVAGVVVVVTGVVAVQVRVYTNTITEPGEHGSSRSSSSITGVVAVQVRVYTYTITEPGEHGSSRSSSSSYRSSSRTSSC